MTFLKSDRQAKWVGVCLQKNKFQLTPSLWILKKEIS